MISLCADFNKAESLCAGLTPNAYLCTVLCLGEIYSEDNICDIYIQYIDDQPTAIFSKFSGAITLYPISDRMDSGEISEFISFIGCDYIVCPDTIRLRDLEDLATPHNVMRLKPDPSPNLRPCRDIRGDKQEAIALSRPDTALHDFGQHKANNPGVPLALSHQDAQPDFPIQPTGWDTPAPDRFIKESQTLPRTAGQDQSAARPRPGAHPSAPDAVPMGNSPHSVHTAEENAQLRTTHIHTLTDADGQRIDGHTAHSTNSSAHPAADHASRLIDADRPRPGSNGGLHIDANPSPRDGQARTHTAHHDTALPDLCQHKANNPGVPLALSLQAAQPDFPIQPTGLDTPSPDRFSKETQTLPRTAGQDQSAAQSRPGAQPSVPDAYPMGNSPHSAHPAEENAQSRTTHTHALTDADGQRIDGHTAHPTNSGAHTAADHASRLIDADRPRPGSNGSMYIDVNPSPRDGQARTHTLHHDTTLPDFGQHKANNPGVLLALSLQAAQPDFPIQPTGWDTPSPDRFSKESQTLPRTAGQDQYTAQSRPGARPSAPDAYPMGNSPHSAHTAEENAQSRTTHAHTLTDADGQCIDGHTAHPTNSGAHTAADHANHAPRLTDADRPRDGSNGGLHIDANPSPRDVYAVLSQQDNPVIKDYGNWYVDLSHRLRHGYAKAAVIKQDGIPIACALTNAIYKDSAVLGGIAVVPSYRKQGYGRLAVNAVCNMLPGYRIFLLCEDHNIAFYRKCGFELSHRGDTM